MPNPIGNANTPIVNTSILSISKSLQCSFSCFSCHICSTGVCGMRRYSRNIFQWNKSDIKDTRMTTWDYFLEWGLVRQSITISVSALQYIVIGIGAGSSCFYKNLVMPLSMMPNWSLDEDSICEIILTKGYFLRHIGRKPQCLESKYVTSFLSISC